MMKYSQQAFTFIEMLIVLSMISIIAMMTLPSLQGFLARANDEVVLKQLQQAIRMAKHEAFAQHVSVGLCKTQDNLHCTNERATGLLVFIDENSDGLITDQDKIVSVIQAAAQTGVLHWRSFPHYRHYLGFAADGATHSDNGTFWYCDIHSGLPKWAVFLNKAARSRVVYPDKNAEIKDTHGNSLSCA